MILSCPACATRFLVPDTAFGATPRRVRCGKCRHEWLAEPPAPEKAPEKPAEKPAEHPFAPQAETPAAPVDPYLSMEDEKPPVEITPPPAEPQPIPEGSNLPAPLSHRAVMTRLLIALGILLMVALLGGVFLYSSVTGQDLFASAPAAPQLSIEGVTTKYVEADGETPDAPKTWALTVEGTIRNKGSDTVTLPPLILTMKDATGVPIGVATPDVQLKKLGAGEVTGFTHTVANPNDKLAEVTVQFGSTEVAASPPTAEEGGTPTPKEEDATAGNGHH